VVSAIFLLPVWAEALIRRRLSPFFLHQISRLSTTRVAFDAKRPSSILFPVLRKPEVVFNGQTVADMSIYCIKVE